MALEHCAKNACPGFDLECPRYFGHATLQFTGFDQLVRIQWNPFEHGSISRITGVRFVSNKLAALIAALMAASMVSGCHTPNHKPTAKRVVSTERKSKVTRSSKRVRVRRAESSY